MEAAVASLVFESAADSIVPDVSNITEWFDFGNVPADAVRQRGGKFVADASPDQIAYLIDRRDLSERTHDALLSVFSGLVGSTRGDQQALRADSAGAPETHSEAVARGPPWPASIAKEFANHEANESWDFIDRSDVPHGRRIHKFVWVFKMKRDGTAKARLCVQGCTLEEGVDYDQTFAKPLRHASARGLFAFAARHRCFVRSVDLVAAYL